MKRILLTATTLTLAACRDTSAPVPQVSPGTADAPVAARGASEPRPGHYIVVFRDDVANVPARAAQLVTAHGGALERTYQYALKGFAAGLTPAAVSAIQQHPDVAVVEQDSYVFAIVTQTGATWGIDRIDQRDLPLSTTYTYTATGSGVHAYIIDTGIRPTHSEFTGRASIAFDAVGDGQNGNDCNGHGTHVAGTVGGVTYGVAKQVTIHAVRVLNCAGNGTTSGVIAGVDWVTANHISPAVANMSLGGGISTTLDQAVANSVASGVTYSIAAGNSNVSACSASPAREPSALTVGSTTTTDARSSFSNFGTCLDVFAPGSSITSAWIGSDVATNTISGTSMAAPHVAGVVARYLETNPGASPTTVMNTLISNATAGKVTSPGTGSPNLLLYANYTDGPPPPPNQPPVAAFTWSCVGFTCTLDGRSSTDDVGIVSYFWNLNKFPDPTATGPVVTAEYPHEGTRTVTLTVTDGGGLTSSITQVITIGTPPPPNQPPVAAFTYSCTNLNCTFNSSGSSDDVGITNRSWAFGDGTTAGNVVSPAKTYSAGGTYNVTLTVTDGGGLSNSVTQAVTVTAPPPPPNQPPVAAFTFSCTNLNCSFNSSGSSDDVAITNRSWTFGDGTTAGNVVSPNKTYAAPGTYDVTLTVTDGGGLTNSITQQVTVTTPPQNQPPVARFTWSCAGTTCTLDGRTSSDDNGIVSYFWDLNRFPDPTASGPVVTVTYAHSGTRTVTLTVTDAAGLTNSVTQVITIP